MLLFSFAADGVYFVAVRGRFAGVAVFIAAVGGNKIQQAAQGCVFAIRCYFGLLPFWSSNRILRGTLKDTYLVS
ncbi:MAG: hypothetical protein LIP00_02455 [Parabacteroides sp.]|nr:hypothetical protein [Parabacteroides sp.]